MPVTPTAKRALRQSSFRAVVNLRRKKSAKRSVDAFKSAPEAQKLSLAVSQVDRSLKHHLITKNKAARMKSQLASLLAAKSGATPKAATK